MDLISETVFIWCSQDRPKKGLEVILSAWESVYEPEKNMVLLVIGCAPRDPMLGVRFLGRIQNDLLPEYYQVADVMLFSTLCEEGFGMSLVEALHCGCYCIASALGGVPEVLQFGKLGELIDNPFLASEWARAINAYLLKPVEAPSIPADLYTTQNWNSDMNKIITDAKRTLESL
ncbi:MAG: glycosyltransferase family 4 protein [Flavobacterium sp.]|nr:glycosyltransferase family 4 protein [Flavobacterium sp.]